MPHNPSDRPRDLTQRREEFLRSFVRRGVELTEELLVENRSLQDRLLALEEDNARMRAQLASDDAIRELLQKIEALERERSLLVQRSSQLERDRNQDAGRYREVERDLNELATLYVAGDQLAIQSSPRHVLRALRELLEQLLGVRSFVLYRIEPDGAECAPILKHGPLAATATRLSLLEGRIADACLTGMSHLIEPPFAPGGPVAIVPLIAAGETLGVLVVLELLPHKAQWALVDRELFKLLSRRAASSLLAAAAQRAQVTPREAMRVFDVVTPAEPVAERNG